MIRNANPLSHASAELLDDNENETHLKAIREKLSDILKETIENLSV